MKKSKSVLVISSNQKEIEVIRRIFNRIDREITVLSADSGRDALDALMGGFRGLKKATQAGNPFRPDLILIDEELNDMRAYAFLEIIKKYYTLSQIKSYLLSEKISEWQENAHYALVDGFLQRPITDDAQTLDRFRQLVGKLSEDSVAGTSLLGLAGASTLKAKLFALKASGALFKAAACIAGVTMITAAVIESRKEDNSARVSNGGGTIVVKDQPDFIPDPAPTLTFDTLPAEPAEQPTPTIVVAEEEISAPPQDTIEILPEEIPVTDSVRPKRTYRISVRESGGTK